MTARIEKHTILSAVILLWISSLFSNVRIINGNDTSFVEILLFYPRLLNQFSYDMIATMEYEDWYFFVMPVCISLPMIPILCKELRSGYYKFIKLRMGDKYFVVQILVTHFIIAGIVFILSTLAFRFFLSILFGWNLKKIIFFQLQKTMYNLLYLFMISGTSIILAVTTADVYISLTGSFVINYIIYSKSLSVGQIFIITIILYLLTAYIVKKRWIKC
ncbi:hypothetical protein [Agathobacter sp.]